MTPTLRLAILTVSAIAFASEDLAEVRLPAVFGRHIVLQRDLPVPVWRTATPGERVTVKFAGQTASTVAGVDGRWRVDLKPLKADDNPQTFTVTGTTTVTLDDVLVGEVWLGSGQSNMARTVDKAAAADARLPRVRLLQMPPKMEKKPATIVDAEWKECTPETAAGFSAVLYHFGRRLHQDLDVPIGLINASRGSTAIEQFLPPPKAGPLFNGTIAPLVPFAIRGIVWYQGEANVQSGAGLAYAGKLAALIEGWRKQWGREVSFYLVQLAPLKNYKPGSLPPVWEAQTTALKIPRTGMMVTTDLAGNMANIHPGNKVDVGRRLAMWALAKDYGRTDLTYSGPLYKSMKVEGGRVRLKFAHADGLKSRDGKPLTEFEMAGPDGTFVPAMATVDGDALMVEAAGVAAPKAVRFAWQNAPSPNLTNAAGLPAAPFHTDNWTGGTAD